MEFYRVADLSRVWIVADIFASDAQNFRPGQLLGVALSGEGKSFTARVTEILPQVDPSTRTLKLRLEAVNPGFSAPGNVRRVELPASFPAGLAIPVDALIDTGREQRVFVERGSEMFEPRHVQTGWRLGDRVQVLQGLSEGERVVSAGTSWWIRRAGSSRATLRPRSRQARRHLHRPCAQMVWRLAPAK